jgi:dihydrofolate synthase/folylpolyglutamate synthase
LNDAVPLCPGHRRGLLARVKKDGPRPHARRAGPPPCPPTSKAYGQALDRLLAAPTLPKLGLQRMEALCRALGAPHRAVPVLHIAGTKGKGSTAAFAASILQSAGYVVGLTTSPHLLAARERIRVDGEPIDERAFVALERIVHRAAATLDPVLDVPSFFERTVAMAFARFAGAVGRAVDVAVVEVGLGGRLDATNVVMPRAAAITRLGLDHTEFLGDTLAAIAGEKAGILKPGVPAVTVVQSPDAADVLARVAAAVGCPLTVVHDDPTLQPSLIGAHQRENASLACALVRAAGYVVDDVVVARGIAETSWPARYETVARAPLVIVDGAHNVDAARALRATLDDDARLRGRPRHFVLGVSRGHDPATIGTPLLAGGAASVVATRAAQPRALPPAEVARAVARFVPCDVVDVVAAAVELGVARAARDGGVVVVTGSLFVAGEARACFVPMARDPARPAW